MGQMLRGTYEQALVSAVVPLIRPGWICFDVGAHFGYYALLLAALVGEQGTVHAFEPVPYNVRLLELHVAKNQKGSVIRIYPLALSDTNAGSVRCALSSSGSTTSLPPVSCRAPISSRLTWREPRRLAEQWRDTPDEAPQLAPLVDDGQDESPREASPPVGGDFPGAQFRGADEKPRGEFRLCPVQRWAQDLPHEVFGSTALFGDVAVHRGESVGEVVGIFPRSGEQLPYPVPCCGEALRRGVVRRSEPTVTEASGTAQARFRSPTPDPERGSRFLQGVGLQRHAFRGVVSAAELRLAPYEEGAHYPH